MTVLSETTLQDMLSDIDQVMFQSSSNNISESAEVVTRLANKIIPTVMV